MGLLDDAIREHLELKRRHGAAEEEVRRQEQEALGPPRRGEVPEPLAPPAVTEPESEAGAAIEPAVDVPAVDPAPEPLDDDRTAAYAAAPEAEAPPEPNEPAPRSVYKDEPWLADAAPAADPDAPADDVLEETPDFLQETPEHDRLWFEQRPPRDFDFDK